MRSLPLGGGVSLVCVCVQDAAQRIPTPRPPKKKEREAEVHRTQHHSTRHTHVTRQEGNTRNNANPQMKQNTRSP